MGRPCPSWPINRSASITALVVTPTGRYGVQAHLLLGLAEGEPVGVAGHQEAGDPAAARPVRANSV